MRVKTIRHLKKNAETLDAFETMVGTPNGLTAYEIESYAERKCRNEAMALIKLMTFSSRDKEQGKLISRDTLLSRLAQRCHRYQEEGEGKV